MMMWIPYEIFLISDWVWQWNFNFSSRTTPRNLVHGDLAITSLFKETVIEWMSNYFEEWNIINVVLDGLIVSLFFTHQEWTFAKSALSLSCNAPDLLSDVKMVVSSA